jgi:hypothetical protein
MPRSVDHPASSTLFAIRVFVIAEADTSPTVILRARFTSARENL